MARASYQHHHSLKIGKTYKKKPAATVLPINKTKQKIAEKDIDAYVASIAIKDRVKKPKLSLKF
ncbi:hypothetical protein KGP36_03030 [Patescibacteria group bacterium]|nr:hypothetical protein [Patescibacteria group bacterium]